MHFKTSLSAHVHSVTPSPAHICFKLSNCGISNLGSCGSIICMQCIVNSFNGGGEAPIIQDGMIETFTSVYASGVR
jgi:hypothetical protein